MWKQQVVRNLLRNEPEFWKRRNSLWKSVRWRSLFDKNFWVREWLQEITLKFQIKKSKSCNIFLEKSLQENDFDKSSFLLQWVLMEIHSLPEVKPYHFHIGNMLKFRKTVTHVVYYFCLLWLRKFWTSLRRKPLGN